MIENEIPSTPPVASDSAPRHETSGTDSNLRSLGIILTSVICAGTAQLVIKAALNQIGELELSVAMLTSMISSPLLILGLAIYAASAFLWLIALMKTDLSFAYPFISLSYVIVLVGGAVVFNEQLTIMRVLGFAVIVAGVLLIAREKRDDEPRRISSNRTT